MIDYTTRDYAGFRTAILQYISDHIPEYTDFSESDFGVVLSEAIAHALDLLSYYNDRTASELFITTAQEEGSIDKLCALHGYVRHSASSAEFTQEFTKNSSYLAQDVVIPPYTRVGSQVGQTTIEFYTKDELTIPAGDSTGEVAVVEGVWVSGDIIGSGDGNKWQKCTCSYTDIDNASLVVQVNDGANWVTWEQVDSFIGSSATDKHYRVLFANGETTIEFGSGYAGQKPTVGTSNIMAHYRVCSGLAGNVVATSINQLLDSLAEITSTEGQEQTVIGTDRETIEETRVKAIANLRTWDRAVTLQDYADLAALNTQVQLSSAEALVNQGTLTIYIYIVPVGTDYIPTTDLKTEIETFFENKKELGREVIVSDPTKQDITVVCDVQAHVTYKNTDIRALVVPVVEAFFTKGERTLGETLQPSDLMTEILQISGVRACSVTFDGVYTPITLPTGSFAGLTTLIQESIVVTGGLG